MELIYIHEVGRPTRKSGDKEAVSWIFGLGCIIILEEHIEKLQYNLLELKKQYKIPKNVELHGSDICRATKSYFKHLRTDNENINLLNDIAKLIGETNTIKLATVMALNDDTKNTPRNRLYPKLFKMINHYYDTIRKKGQLLSVYSHSPGKESCEIEKYFSDWIKARVLNSGEDISGAHVFKSPTLFTKQTLAPLREIADNAAFFYRGKIAEKVCHTHDMDVSMRYELCIKWFEKSEHRFIHNGFDYLK